MIALEIIHFYLNVLISKSVIILTLASQGPIFLSPVPYSLFSLFFLHWSPPLHAWRLISMGHLFSKTTCMQPTPLPVCGGSFLISLISLVSSAPPQTSTSYSITCTSCWWLSPPPTPHAENTATVERNCGPWSDPGTSQCMSNLLSLFCS